MTGKITNIAKNTSYFTFALILQKIISFTYFTLIARGLGPEDLGKYYFAISFTTLFAIFIDFGIANVLTREVAKKPEDAQKLLSGTLAIKIPLTIITWLAVFFAINLLGYSELVKQLVYLSSICMILDSFSLAFFAVIRGFHNLSHESVVSVLFQLIVFIFGLSFLYAGKGLGWIMLALVLASVIKFLYAFALLVIKWHLNLFPILDKKYTASLFTLAIPFGIFAIFQRGYMYLDSVFLSIFAGDKYVGLYQVAFKIIFALQFLPLAFIATLYPAMSNYWLNNRQQLTVTFERAMNYLTIISLPISFGIIALADKIMLLFKTGFDEAILPLQISIASLIFIFLIFPVGSLLNACDRQKQNTIIMGITFLASIIMNLILIPKFQAIGASITLALTNLFMFILSMVVAKKISDFRMAIILKVFFKSLVASLVMFLAVLYLKNSINIFILSILGGLIYFFILFIIGGFKKEDIFSIYQSFFKKSI
jgi:O-antigen/teichoic acid export membrane protein